MRAVFRMAGRSRCISVALVGLVTTLLAPFIATEALYGFALHDLGGPPTVPVTRALPRLAQAAFWLHGGEGPPLVAEPMPAWRWAWALLLDRRALLQERKGWRAASLAARCWLADRAVAPRGVGWHLAFWAATVWTSSHFDAAQMTQVWMEGAWFGRGARGIDAAAGVYFGRPVNDLAPQELVLLVALETAPRRFDPYCRPGQAVAVRNSLLRRLLTSGFLTDVEYQSAVTQPLGVVQGDCEERSR
jgi:hypothetical protein